MANEKLKGSSEQAFNPEELSGERAEQQERLQEEIERNAEKGREDLDEARNELEKTLEKSAAEKERNDKEDAAEKSPAERRRGPISRQEKAASFNKTVKDMQSQLSPSGRAFSKVIHNPVVEGVSEAVGSTIARPNAILSGSVFAFVFTVIILLVAKHYGYPLSGFETIAAFILGWLLGMAFDFLGVLFRGRRSQ